jgi:hypothetical protein
LTTSLERYEILKKHMHEEAARVIAETLPLAEQVVTKDYLDARLAQLESRIDRRMLMFMATQWLGFAGMIVALFIKS